MRRVASLIAAFAFAAQAHAADLSVSIRSVGGKPQADVVILAYPATRPANAPRLAMTYKMNQKNMKFDPFMLVVPVGAEVSFPNLDPVMHHVYSFSQPHPFELKLFGKDETRSVKFDKPGVIAVGCNIHDAMAAFIRVTDTPYAAKTDAAGNVVLRDMPDGAVKLVIWHPYLKAPGRELVRPIVMPRDAKLTLTADLKPAPDVHAY